MDSRSPKAYPPASLMYLPLLQAAEPVLPTVFFSYFDVPTSDTHQTVFGCFVLFLVPIDKQNKMCTLLDK